jgi:2-phosphosulfolactate phosphatase
VVAAGLIAAGASATPDAVASAAAAACLQPLADCPSGAELLARGFASDVELAAEEDATDVVAVLADGRFRPVVA